MPAPDPAEDYLARFDDLLVSQAQRQALRDYVVALLQPRERNKTLVALAGAESGIGSTHREVQRLQWFGSESRWDHEPLTGWRIELLVTNPATCPHEESALLLDDSTPQERARHRVRLPAVHRLPCLDPELDRGGDHRLGASPVQLRIVERLLLWPRPAGGRAGVGLVVGCGIWAWARCACRQVSIR
jgi:hypothetical protein